MMIRALLVSGLLWWAAGGRDAAAQALDPAPFDAGTPAFTELWVDPVSGHDDHGGLSAADALKTLRAAWALVPAMTAAGGFRINILPGTLPFDESGHNYFADRQGSREAPVVVSAAGGPGTVVIEGGLNIARCRSLYLVDLTLAAGGDLPTFANNVLHLEGCTDVLMRRLTVTGPDPALHPDNYDIQEALKANQCGGVYLEDSDVSGAYQTAVDLFSVQGGHVIGSRVHGAGEWGGTLDDVKKMNHSIPMMASTSKDFPFVAVSPLCPQFFSWQELWYSINNMIDEVTAKYNIDPDRIYLTGLSLGGIGTWSTALQFPDKFAAIAPVCGSVDPDKVEKLKNLPIWAFHGAKDTVVSMDQEQKAVDVLKSCGGNIKYTVYPDVEHDAWNKAYPNKELYAWFLQHTRTKNKPQK